MRTRIWNEVSFLYVLAERSIFKQRLGLDTFVKNIIQTSLCTTYLKTLVQPATTAIIIHESMLDLDISSRGSDIDEYRDGGACLILATEYPSYEAGIPQSLSSRFDAVLPEEVVLRDPGTLLYFVRDLLAGNLLLNVQNQKHSKKILERLLD